MGLKLHEELRQGVSGHCATFDNAPLPSVATPLSDLEALEAANNAASATPTESPLPPRRGGVEHYSDDEPPPPSMVTPPSGPSSTGDDDLYTTGSSAGAAIRFKIATLEVWALDERACRGMKACESHSLVPMHEERVAQAASPSTPEPPSRELRVQAWP